VVEQIEEFYKAITIKSYTINLQDFEITSKGWGKRFVCLALVDPFDKK
jgi:hypothetical protein